MRHRVNTITEASEFTFPGSVRLRSPKQFQANFSQGRRISTALFRLHANLLDADSATTVAVARLGISVSKRVAQRAVERNRIKRIARDSFRHQRTQLPPGDYVLLAQRDAAGAPSATLRVALNTLWQRATALKPAPAAPTIPIPAQDAAAKPD